MDSTVLHRLAELPDDAAAMLAVVVSVEGSSYRGPGALRVWTPDGRSVGVVSGGCLEADLAERRCRDAARGELLRYDLRGGDDDVWGLAAGCNGIIEVWLQPLPPGRPSPYRSAARWLAAGRTVVVTTILPDGEQWAVAEGEPPLVEGAPRPVRPGERAFVDRREPPPLLVVYGKGADARPLVELARRVGFRVRQFGPADDLAAAVGADPPAAAVVMSHHFPGDRAALEVLLRSSARYVGALGPRQRTLQMVPPPWPEALHAPVGLDIGAEDPEEIAVAVVAEVLAVLRGASGGHLRDRSGPIHRRRTVAVR